jgi:hypothetical protein
MVVQGNSFFLFIVYDNWSEDICFVFRLNPGILAFFLPDHIEMFIFLMQRNLIQDYVENEDGKNEN